MLAQTIRGFERVSFEQWQKDKPSDVDDALWFELYEELKSPKRATKGSAGYDVFAPFAFTLEPNEDITIPTGFKSYMQNGEALFGFVRSSLGFKNYVRLANTTMVGDKDYYNNPKNEGHYFIKIRNESNIQLTIEKGDAFAQVVFMPFLLADGDDFESGDDRNGGVGSTSKNK